MPGPRFQRLALITSLATYFLIIMGVTVRATGSGLGCPDWPLCHGQIIPPFEFTAIIEYTHRLIAAIASSLMLVTVGIAWLRYRHDRPVVGAATLGPLLLVVQIVLGAVVVALELPPMVVLVHLGFAMLIQGTLVWLTVFARPRPAAVGAPAGKVIVKAAGNRFARFATITTAGVFLLMMTGAYVRATSSSWACIGFPLCNGELLPFGQSSYTDIHLLHRLMAYTVGTMVLATIVHAERTRRHIPAIRWTARLTGIALVAQIGIGVWGVVTGVPMHVQIAHVAGAAAVWSAMVALLAFILRGGDTVLTAAATEPVARRVPAAATEGAGFRQTLMAYVMLTKPRIIVLLLVTTLGAIFIAAPEAPSAVVVLATLVGGALSAGGANAMNQYLDRDIDVLMGRTSLRPIPSGNVTPEQALRFGLTLAVLSFLIMIVFVNPLAAVLSLIALAYYVLIYTSWLKRTTPSNIVIGGAAGAMPPMIGCAAVTGEVGLLAWFLFAIVFFWTPPHFWALALLMKKEYARAGVPMLPIVRGDAETRWQILLYSVLLLAVTLVLYSFQLMGGFYLAASALLGVALVYYAVVLLRDATTQAARALFKYSIYYLALLFLAMIADRNPAGLLATYQVAMGAAFCGLLGYYVVMLLRETPLARLAMRADGGVQADRQATL